MSIKLLAGVAVMAVSSTPGASNSLPASSGTAA